MTALLERPIVDDATSRQFLAAAGAAGLLAGCSAARSEPAPAGPATRRVTHELGAFDVPLDPQRVVVLEGRLGLEAVLALGLNPVAVGENTFDDDGKVASFLEWDPAEATKIGQLDNLGLEQVTVLRPDLLVGRDSNIEEAAALAAVAPPRGGAHRRTERGMGKHGRHAVPATLTTHALCCDLRRRRDAGRHRA